jgi:hypothetical protein
MEAFKDLIITGQVARLKAILKQIISNLPSKWKLREDLISEYSRNVSKDSNEIGCFESPELNDEVVLVWLMLWDSELKVNNIIPTKFNSLSYKKYNFFLDKFYSDCVRKEVDSAELNVLITEGYYNIETIAGHETYILMEKWEKGCNRSSGGNSNPHDFETWADFVCAAFRNSSRLTPDLFGRWLEEDRNWSNDGATGKLILDYEYGLSILEHYVTNP